MIQIKSKAKIAAKPKKKSARKVSAKVPRRPVGYFELTAAEVAEINMLDNAVMEMNSREFERRRAAGRGKA